MKNLFLSLVLLLTVSFAFANDNYNNSENLAKAISFKSIDDFQSSNAVTINSISELSELNRILSNVNEMCSVSFTFEINIGVFSASGTIEGSCQEAQDFFSWIKKLFAMY